MRKGLFNLIPFYIFLEVRCGYSPISDDKRDGSVLLPTSSRGRYLAEIIRRQAVDGTEIEFNEDADRINAEAKKKTKIHSEEVLPYVIAEQERRITLHKRVMSAIQNGEYGCTIAEMRRKPPVIIRKGQMFRCPINRGPMEPDGSGIIKCEDGINPTSIMFDSCLSAEDEELYVSDENYYLCNRHRLKGPDLPRSGDTVVACPPCERTSLEYTRKKCALDDSNDVVVHYRYYPDKTHKSVTEIDPDGEICEHWTPCQIGYIFGLPVPEHATPAKELWPGEYVPDDITSDEDSHKEYVTTHNPYDIGLVKVSVPPGMRYSAIGKYFTGTDGSRRKDTVSTRYHVAPKNIEVHVQELKSFDKVTIHFDPIEPDDIGSYYIEFEDIKHPEQPHKIVELVEFEEGTTEIIPTELITMPGRELNITEIKVNCVDCSCGQVTVRGEDGVTRQLDPKTYNFHKITDEEAEFGLYTEEASCEYFGEYFAHLTTGDTEEIVKIFTVKRPSKKPDLFKSLIPVSFLLLWLL